MKIKKILVLHSDVADDAALDEQDTLIQAKEVLEGLAGMGYGVQMLPFKPDLDKTISEIKEYAPDLVFNLVETLFADGQLIHVAPSILDSLQIPYTGCSKDSIFLTSHKIFSKKWMDFNEIPTPQWISLKDHSNGFKAGDYIFKAVWEHASVGLDSNSVLKIASPEEAVKILKEKKENLKKDFFAEQYIEGREFNIAMLSGKILPIPEICFDNFEKGRIKIVDYKAKWDEESFEYKNTVRRFLKKEEDKELFDKMEKIALKCWDAFHLNGFVRVDFRVDEEGNPFVLEVNANPCISKDAGFFAACVQAGISYEEMLREILSDLSV